MTRFDGATLDRRHAGARIRAPLSASSDKVSTAALMAFAAILPLVPRPTTGTLGEILAGGLVSILIVSLVVACSRAELDAPTSRTVARLVVVIVILAISEGGKILVTQDWQEFAYLTGRFLALTLSLSVFIWCRVSGVPPSRFLRNFTVGYLLLAVIMIYIGLSGSSVFGQVRPGRDLGIALPFSKTPGVPRSYGELSILSSVAWAYLLTQWRHLRKAIWLPSAVLIMTSELVAQSRTGLLAWALVTLVFVVLRARPSAFFARALVLATALVPLLADLAVARGRNSGLVSFVVGSDTLANNVTTRLSLNRLATDMLLNSDLKSLTFGIGRSTWVDASQQLTGATTELHNQLLASLTFDGIFVGSLFILTCYLVPLWRLSGQVRNGDPESLLLFIAGIGALFSVQFYPGFFSLTISLIVGLLWSATWRSSHGGNGRPDESVPGDASQARSRSPRRDVGAGSHGLRGGSWR